MCGRSRRTAGPCPGGGGAGALPRLGGCRAHHRADHADRRRTVRRDRQGPVNRYQRRSDNMARQRRTHDTVRTDVGHFGRTEAGPLSVHRSAGAVAARAAAHGRVARRSIADMDLTDIHRDVGFGRQRMQDAFQYRLNGVEMVVYFRRRGGAPRDQSGCQPIPGREGRSCRTVLARRWWSFTRR